MNKHNILILSLSGIGNFLMHTPTISAIRQQLPASRITVWVAPRSTKILAENYPDIDEVIEMPIRTTFTSHLRNIGALREKSFTHALMLSPGQQIKGALYMFLSGIPIRIAHQYLFQGYHQNNLLLTNSAVEQNDLHDIEQNLNLLPLIGLKIPPQPHLYHHPITSHQSALADSFLRNLNLSPNQSIIGIHPGSAPGFSWKRWPLDRWASFAIQLITKQHAHILIFGGPDEIEQKRQLKEHIEKNINSTRAGGVSVVSTDLLTVAAIIKRCDLFISNDSGLMHLSAAVGTKTLGLFGPTDEIKTGPRGLHSHAIRASKTTPVYDTEYNYQLAQETHSSLLKLDSQSVIAEISNLVSNIKY